MKRILTVLALCALVLNCSQFTKVRGVATFETIPNVDYYEFRTMKLTGAGFPSTAHIVIVGDTTLLRAQWTQEFKTMAYDSQPNPNYLYGFTSDTLKYLIPESEVQYDTLSADLRRAVSNDVAMELEDGPYFLQVRTGRRNFILNKTLWSKWSDGFPFRAHIPDDPPTRATNLIIL